VPEAIATPVPEAIATPVPVKNSKPKINSKAKNISLKKH